MKKIAFEIQGRYGKLYGWETVSTEATPKEAQEQLKCYNDNEPEYPHKIKKVWVLE